MGNFLKNLQVFCTTAFMTTAFAVNVSAAIPEENILLEIDGDDNLVSYEEESYNWHESWGTDQLSTTGKVNCIKEGAKVKFSLTSDEGINYSDSWTGEKTSNAVLNGRIYKLDGNTITHISDRNEIIQKSLSTDTPVEIDFSRSNLSNTAFLSGPDGTLIKENQFNTNFLYVFTVEDWEDEDINQKIPTYVIRIAGESTTPKTTTPETATPETTTPETTTPETTTPETATPETTTPETATPETTTPETVTPEIAAPEVVTPQTSVGGKFTAIPHTVPISITENATTIRSYSINNTDYFSLRDIASLLNGTEKQFDIQYDKTTKTVALTTQKPYALASMDYTNGDDMAQKEVTSTTVMLNVDGQNISSVAYNINGTNYFSIADLNKFIAIVD